MVHQGGTKKNLKSKKSKSKIFMVHQGGAMLGERAAAPTLGLIVCFYSVTTGVAYFARKLTPLKSNTKINAAGYPVPRCSLSLEF